MMATVTREGKTEEEYHSAVSDALCKLSEHMNGIKIDPELEAKGVGLHRHREYLRRHK